LNLKNVSSGALITDVAHGSLAAEAGLQRGQVITRIGGTEVHNAQEAADALDKADLKKGVRLQVATRFGSRYFFVQEEQ
jgi:S1-C subfamily serine protease